MKLSIALLSSVFMIAACNGQDLAPKNSVRQQEAAKAAAVAQSVDFSAGNAERDNVLRRSEMVANPGLVGYVVLFNFNQPVAYFQIKGKITSGGKRLEPPMMEYDINTYEAGDPIGPAPSYDGTFGESDSYVYFWTVNDQYIQWSGDYLYSDKPLSPAKSAAMTITQ